jgi:hypothetical protein
MDAKHGFGSNQVKIKIETAEITFYAKLQVTVTAP